MTLPLERRSEWKWIHVSIIFKLHNHWGKHCTEQCHTLPCVLYFLCFQEKLFYNIFRSVKTVFCDFQSSLRDSDIHSSLLSRDASSYNPIAWTQPVLFLLCFTPVWPCGLFTVVTRLNINVLLNEIYITLSRIQHLITGRERYMLDMDHWKNLSTPPRYNAPTPRVRTDGCFVVPLHDLHSKNNVILWCYILGNKIKCYYACSLLLII